MNNWNDLENQLRSWKPRAPSEKVKARLFGGAAGHAAAAVDAGHPVSHPAWHWLAPAMAVFLFGMFVVGRHPGGLGPTSGVLAQFGMMEPERARESHYANNSVQITTIDWTNGSHSLTTAPPVSGTNRLIQ